MDDTRSTFRSTSRAPTSRVVVGVDDSDASSAAVAYAASAAVARGLPLRVVHAYQRGHAGPETMQLRFAEPARIAMTTLEAASERAADLVDGRVPVGGCIRQGDAVSCLVEDSHTAALVVVGRHHRAGLAEMTHRPVWARVAARAHAPVAVVPEHVGVGTTARPVTVAVDVPSRSTSILREGFRTAAAARLALRVIHVWRPPRLTEDVPVDGRTWIPTTEAERRRMLEQAVARIAREFPEVAVRIDVVLGVAAQELSAATLKSGAMVLGRHDPLWPTPRLGSVAGYVLRSALCPVIVVPPRLDDRAPAPRRAAPGSRGATAAPSPVDR